MRSIVFLAPLLTLAAACGQSDAKPDPPAPTTTTTTTTTTATMVKAADPAPDPMVASRAEAKTIFETRCVACHGANGQGDGAAAAPLNPKPRDFHDRAWGAQISDETIEKTIVAGGQALGKSPLMPANPDLADKPDVVRALRETVRGFGQ